MLSLSLVAMAVRRFAVDVMLGRLAKWLRLLGQDVAYGSQVRGKSLVRVARLEQRAILTRERRLRADPKLPLLVIDSDRFREQLQQVVLAYGIDPFADLFTRCSRCNATLEPVSPREVQARVPLYVAETAIRFVRCPRCRHLYWPGTHHERMVGELRKLFPARSS